MKQVSVIAGGKKAPMAFSAAFKPSPLAEPIMPPLPKSGKYVQPKTKPTKDDCQSIDFVKERLRRIKNMIGRFPTYDEIAKYDCRMVADAPANYHGGLGEVRKEMGFGIDYRNGKHSLKNEKAFYDELLDISRANWYTPPDNKFFNSAIGSRYRNATRLHGGRVIVVGKIRASLCEELTKSGFSDSAQMKSKAAIMQMIKDHFGLFWRDDLDLRSLNHEKPAFAWAIRLHGGTKEFRDNRDAEKRLWIVELGKNIANEHGAHALETKWLMKNGYIDVIGEIVANYKGDFEEFKKEVLAQMAEKNLEPI